MFNDLINREVIVVVSSRTEFLLEYNGLLCEENENVIKLKNVDINQEMLNFQKNVFGSNMGIYKQNIDEVIINKNYVISCIKK